MLGARCGPDPALGTGDTEEHAPALALEEPRGDLVTPGHHAGLGIRLLRELRPGSWPLLQVFSLPGNHLLIPLAPGLETCRAFGDMSMCSQRHHFSSQTFSREVGAVRQSQDTNPGPEPAQPRFCFSISYSHPLPASVLLFSGRDRKEKVARYPALC